VFARDCAAAARGVLPTRVTFCLARRFWITARASPSEANWFARGQRFALPAAPALCHDLLDLALGGHEGVAERDVRIFVCVIVGALSVHDDLASGNAHLDPRLVKHALVVVAMRRIDHDMAARDAIADVFQVLDMVANPRFERRGRFHAAK
jgi:hypothetical protein